WCTPNTEAHAFSLHDALPICSHRSLQHGSDLCTHVACEELALALGRAARFAHQRRRVTVRLHVPLTKLEALRPVEQLFELFGSQDRKSTRLNSSHVKISYAVF